MDNKQVIPIFFAVDDGYIPFLAVSIQSLADHASDENQYVIKVLYTNISEENQKKISKYERENISIEFVDLNYYIEKIKDKLYTRDYYSKTTYFIFLFVLHLLCNETYVLLPFISLQRRLLWTIFNFYSDASCKEALSKHNSCLCFLY